MYRTLVVTMRKAHLQNRMWLQARTAPLGTHGLIAGRLHQRQQVVDTGLQLPRCRAKGVQVRGMRLGRVGDAPVDRGLCWRQLWTDLASTIAEGDHAIEGLAREHVDVLPLLAGDVPT